MLEKKESFNISIDDDGNITEKKYIVVLEDGREISRSAPTTQTINPGDPMQRLAIASERTRGVAALVHTPEVIKEYENLKALESKKNK